MSISVFFWAFYYGCVTGRESLWLHHSGAGELHKGYMEASILPQSLIQFRCHGLLNLLVEVGIVEQLCEGIVIVQEALGYDIAEFIREQRPNKHFCAVILGIFFEFLNIRVFHEHLINTFNDYSVSIRELTLKAFIDLINNVLQCGYNV